MDGQSPSFDAPAPEINEIDELIHSWHAIPATERSERFKSLPRAEAEELFLNLGAADQAELYLEVPPTERRSWVRMLAPDDVADLVQELGDEYRADILTLLDSSTRNEVAALLAYAEDEAGGLMSPRFARVRPDMTVEEAIQYLRAQTQSKVETIYYAYVLDSKQQLLGVVSLRELFAAAGKRKVSEIMATDLVTVPETMDQEEVSRLFSDWGFLAVPVVTESGVMKGIVTADDIVDVVQEEATEDFQRFGGAAAIDTPYFNASLGHLVSKRAPWLSVLFLASLLTATAMASYEDEIEKAVVLAVFIPLIISSGGNSGSQASTLIVRAMALGEVRPRDWWRVFLREAASGLILGLIVGLLGLARVVLWPGREDAYGADYLALGFTVAISLGSIVLWGTLAGSMLPFLLRVMRLDPAVASAPFVATLVDVTGLIIYFTVATFFLGSTLG